MPPIVFPGMVTVKLTHSAGQIGIRGLYHEMVVIVHETVGMAQPVMPLNDGIKDK